MSQPFSEEMFFFCDLACSGITRQIVVQIIRASTPLNEDGADDHTDGAQRVSQDVQEHRPHVVVPHRLDGHAPEQLPRCNVPAG